VLLRRKTQRSPERYLLHRNQRKSRLLIQTRMALAASGSKVAGTLRVPSARVFPHSKSWFLSRVLRTALGVCLLLSKVSAIRAFHDCIDARKCGQTGRVLSSKAPALSTANAVAACSHRLQPVVDGRMKSQPRMRLKRGRRRFAADWQGDVPASHSLPPHSRWGWHGTVDRRLKPAATCCDRIRGQQMAVTSMNQSQSGVRSPSTQS
jgi:hypothetical protein